MANRPNEGRMPAEHGRPDRGGVMDDRAREHGSDEAVRGIGDRDDEFEDAEDMEAEDTEDTDENEEGSF